MSPARCVRATAYRLNWVNTAGWRTPSMSSAILDLEGADRDPGLGEARQPLIRSVYRLAQRAERDPEAREQLQSIATQFLSFQQLQAAAQDSAAVATGSAAAVDVPALRYCISPASFWE